MLLALHRWYYTSNSGLQAQSVLYTEALPGALASVLLDPNTLSTDGTVALNDYTFSDDGSLLAYNLARRVAVPMRGLKTDSVCMTCMPSCIQQTCTTGT